MTEELHDAATASGTSASVPATADPAIDEALAAVEALEDRPTDEHLAVFERAHEQLRRALDTSTRHS